jgi:hypothetical protein
MSPFLTTLGGGSVRGFGRGRKVSGITGIAAPINFQAVESTVLEGGTINLSWTNAVNDKTIELQYTVGGSGWVTYTTYSAGSTSATITMQTNGVYSFRIAYLDNSYIASVNKAQANVTTRPYPPRFSYDYYYGDQDPNLKGYLSNNPYSQANAFARFYIAGNSAYQGNSAVVTYSLTQDGSSVYTNVAAGTQNTVTNYGTYTLWTFVARTYTATTGLYSTAVNHSQYVGSSTGGGIGGNLVSYSGTQRYFSFTCSGGIPQIAYENKWKYSIWYNSAIYCDSAGAYQASFGNGWNNVSSIFAVSGTVYEYISGFPYASAAGAVNYQDFITFRLLDQFGNAMDNILTQGYWYPSTDAYDPASC